MCGCRAWFVWDLVGKPEDRFSQNEAQIAWGVGSHKEFREKTRKQGQVWTDLNLTLREHLRSHETFTVDQIQRDFLRNYH